MILDCGCYMKVDGQVTQLCAVHEAKLEQSLADFEKIADACAEVERLRTALTDMFDLIDEGILVRDTKNDHRDDWALHMLKFAKRLRKVKEVLEPSP